MRWPIAGAIGSATESSSMRSTIPRRIGSVGVSIRSSAAVASRRFPSLAAAIAITISALAERRFAAARAVDDSATATASEPIAMASAALGTGLRRTSRSSRSARVSARALTARPSTNARRSSASALMLG